jgi:hypothetical protein
MSDINVVAVRNLLKSIDKEKRDLLHRVAP